MVAVSAVVGLGLIRVWDPPPVEITRQKQFDWFQSLSPRDPQSLPITVVDIDDESLGAYGQWPWPRTLIAELVRRVATGGSAAIGFNIIFPEEDRTSPDQILRFYPDLQGDVRQSLSALPSHDEILADMIARTRVVLAESTNVERRARGAAEEAAPDGDAKAKVSWVTVGPDPKPRLFQLPGTTGNIAPLADAAAGLGNITLPPEWDGVIRRVPLIFRLGDELRPALAVEMLRVATGERTLAVKSNEAGLVGVIVGGLLAPTDAAGRAWLHYAPPDPARDVSARAVLDGTVEPGRFKGQLVLIGTTAVGLLDAKGTPIGDGMSSLEIQRQLLEVILSKRSLTRPEFVNFVELASILASAALMLFGIPGLRPIWGFVAGLPVLGGLAGGSWHLFEGSGILLDITYPAFANLILYTLFVSMRYAREEAQKREVRRAFAQYISPELVEQLAADTSRLNLGGQIRPMSILFSDIRGFTDLSEGLRDDPERLTAILNQYFTSMTDRILEYRGTIDKYMGDAIMAFWNAPVEDDEHGRHACEAALEMLDGLRKLNQKLEAEAVRSGHAFTPIDIGIGLNTGRCLVGNLGSEHRFSYSAVGDAVNLAARLESLSKVYGVTIIIGEETRALVPEFATLELDLVRVKGKQEAGRIYGLFGLPPVAATPEFKTLAEAHADLIAAYRLGDWAQAEEKLRRCRALESGHDRLYAHYAERIGRFRETPPPPDWDGVYATIAP